MSLLNLEPLAALAAQTMVDSREAKFSEDQITKGVAVLAEQGVFAFGLFLATSKKPDQALLIHNAIRSLLSETGLYQNEDKDRPAYYRGISEKKKDESVTDALRRLMLTKKVMETALTYGRYRAKALGR
jgi:hypothetical protein